MTLKEQLYATLDLLTLEQQSHLLAVARQLQMDSLLVGTAGTILLDSLDQFRFDIGEVNQIMEAIHDNEEIDWNGWQ